MNDLVKLFNPQSKVDHNRFDKLEIAIASPEEILKWSYGEVKKPETINYRTFKPEKDGLFCAKIFGPVKDYECLCGKYRRMKYKDIVCPKCGVEVTLTRVRRERMGHIDLAAPVAHIWFLKSLPSRVALLIDMPLKSIEKVLYFENYVVLEPGITELEFKALLTEEEYLDAIDQYGQDAFEVSMGAEAIHTIFKNMDLQAESQQIQEDLANTNSESKRSKLVRRYRLVEGFLNSNMRPEWMILTVLPVIPPELRPLVPLDGGRFATSDLNDLYRRIINRNNRLKRLLQLNAPDIIVRNEKRMLQESVDALFDNSRRTRPIVGNNRRPLKSLSDMLKGKQGRFRQNLLGKRVDYSGRSVITVGPRLKLHQCGLPKRMALELFKPFIYAKLELYGRAPTIKAAKRMVEREIPEVWDILEEVIHEHPVLLNRAPTLHRLGIQAFEPILIEGKAIQLHPLVCTAFNADFDGDQMALHVPLSLEAQLEARMLMMSSNNILLPANGKPIIVPSQDMILGLYYLTLEVANQPGEGMLFANLGEIEHALEEKIITVHSRIITRYHTVDENNEPIIQRVETTPGRFFISELLPRSSKIPYSLINKLLGKKEISNVLAEVFRHIGQKPTVILADKIMQLGFKSACDSGISFGMDDMVVPETKKNLIAETKAIVDEYELQFQEGLITQGEKYNKVIDTWAKCSDKVAEEMMKEISTAKEGQLQNSVFMMADSGARGSAAQMKQLAGMRGLMAKPSGEIIETPIISNFKEGLTVMEYFNSTHGARKGLADTALKTANSGYLTRRLVDVAQDCTVIEEDCGTDRGITVKAMVNGSNVVSSLGNRVWGRTVADDVIIEGNVLVKAGEIVSEEQATVIDEHNLESIRLRSPLTCEAERGICATCYGQDLSKNRKVNLSEAVGIIAAQSIGEPGTQLTMRTFHIGGAAQGGSEQSSEEASTAGVVALENVEIAINSRGDNIVMSNNAEATINSESGKELVRYRLKHGSKLSVVDAQKVALGDKIVEWDPYTNPVLSEFNGIVKYEDLKVGITMEESLDEATGITRRVVIEEKGSRNKIPSNPRIVILDAKTNQPLEVDGVVIARRLSAGEIISVNEGDEIKAGDILARIPKESSKTSDITGGLPRVAELFEARKPTDLVILADQDGVIEWGRDYKAKREVILHGDNGQDYSYFVPKGRMLSVQEKDRVRLGDQLMDGQPALHDILRVKGIDALADYLVREVQAVYSLQGVEINDKHIEVILRQMLQKAQITKPGDTTLLVGEEVNVKVLEKINNELPLDKTPCEYELVLLGITKASIQTESFISAASFQETIRVLTDAAVSNKSDSLLGLKENVIVGRLIPAGTGAEARRLWKIAKERDEAFIKEQKENGTFAVENLTDDSLIADGVTSEENASEEVATPTTH